MPSQAMITQRNVQAMARIDAIVEMWAGEHTPPNLKVRHRVPKIQDMLRLEALAEWLESVAGAGLGDSVAPHIPLEYLTSDGLRWLANERGVDVSDLSKKTELIEALGG